MNTEDMKYANTNRLKNLILTELDEILRNNNPKRRAPPKESEAVNVAIKMYTLELTVQTVYKDFKDYRFWLQQAQIRRVNSEDWDSPLDYLGCGLR